MKLKNLFFLVSILALLNTITLAQNIKSKIKSSRSVKSVKNKITPANEAPKALAMLKWHYIQADSSRTMWGNYDKPEWLRYYGTAFVDINGDNYMDIVAGRYFYKNPGKNMTGAWARTDFGVNADGCLVVDVDLDKNVDVIAMAYPNVYWLEAMDNEGEKWTAKIIGSVPKTDHVNGQGFRVITLKGLVNPTIFLSGEGGIYAAHVPKKPNETTDWRFRKVVSSFSDEGFDFGDFDGDGDEDIAFGNSTKKGDVPNMLFIATNNGNDIDQEWVATQIGVTENNIDRVEVADFNKDGKPDIAVSEELYPGLEPKANLYTFTNPAEKDEKWQRKDLWKGYSNNNLDVADIDKDGDMDIVTSEHKGHEYPIFLFSNNGDGDYTGYKIARGNESHLGNQLVDLDNDGDLDMVSTAWDYHKFLHIWRNDAIVKSQAQIKKDNKLLNSQMNNNGKKNEQSKPKQKTKKN